MSKTDEETVSVTPKNLRKIAEFHNIAKEKKLLEEREHLSQQALDQREQQHRTFLAQMANVTGQIDRRLQEEAARGNFSYTYVYGANSPPKAFTEYLFKKYKAFKPIWTTVSLPSYGGVRANELGINFTW